MSLDLALARIAEIQAAFAPPTPAPTPAAGTTGSASFAGALSSATATQAPTFTPQATGTVGDKLLAAARAEVGVTEQPPGSNDGPRIGEYRTATAGAGVGPWCAYFVSWAAKQAGAPVGETGQGFGAVAALGAWAERTGRTVDRPQAGDIIVWGGRHIGIVESVDPDGSIHTIEGNSSDSVTRRTYGPDGGGATSYVRLGDPAAPTAAPMLPGAGTVPASPVMTAPIVT